MADEKKKSEDVEAKDEQPDGAESPEEQLEQEAEEEVIEEPANKYERVMMAAAEAGRLNEEARRKGVRPDEKITLAALERVEEGKVKAIVGGKEPPRRRVPLPPRETPVSRDTLFGNPPLVSEPGAKGEEQKKNGDTKD
jgi:DNA-directed RNA polymerase subunit K/omega